MSGPPLDEGVGVIDLARVVVVEVQAYCHWQ
jgi:hypothetical protein